MTIIIISIFSTAKEYQLFRCAHRYLKLYSYQIYRYNTPNQSLRIIWYVFIKNKKIFVKLLLRHCCIFVNNIVWWMSYILYIRRIFCIHGPFIFLVIRNRQENGTSRRTWPRLREDSLNHNSKSSVTDPQHMCVGGRGNNNNNMTLFGRVHCRHS